MNNTVFGIEIGNTNSRISYVDEKGVPRIVENMEGMEYTPSVVYFEDEKYIVVGDVAKENEVISPENVWHFSKEKIGDASDTITIGDTVFCQSQLVALIIRKLIEDTEACLDTKVQDVVLTVPAHWGVNEKILLETAGKMAGLNILEVINETTAAMFMDFYQNSIPEREKNVLIYNLGGTSFSATIVNVHENQMTTVVTEVDEQLGGNDWNQAILTYLENGLRIQKGMNEAFDLDAIQELVLKGEKAKLQLSSKERTKVIVIASGTKACVDYSRQQFEKDTEGLLKQTMRIVETALNKAGKKGIEKIDEILLVGGACKMPQVSKALGNRFPDITINSFDPDLAVVKGAALYGNQLQEERAYPPVTPTPEPETKKNMLMQLELSGKERIANHWEITEDSEILIQQTIQGKVDKIALKLWSSRNVLESLVNFSFDIPKTEDYSCYTYTLEVQKKNVKLLVEYRNSKGFKKTIEHKAVLDELLIII